MNPQRNNSLPHPVSDSEYDEDDFILSSTMQDSLAIPASDIRLVFESDISGISHDPGNESFHNMYSLLEDETLDFYEDEDDTTGGSITNKPSVETKSLEDTVFSTHDENVSMKNSPPRSLQETSEELISIRKIVIDDSSGAQDSNVLSSGSGSELNTPPRKENTNEAEYLPAVPNPSFTDSNNANRGCKQTPIVNHSYNLRSRRSEDRPPKLELQANILTTMNRVPRRTPPVLKRMVP